MSFAADDHGTNPSGPRDLDRPHGVPHDTSPATGPGDVSCVQGGRATGPPARAKAG